MSSSDLDALPGAVDARRGAGFWISAWLPVALGVGVIAVESTSFLGADHTTGPLRYIWEWVFGQFSDQSWEFTHHLIRKTGHFIGYGSLGLLWLRAWWKTRPHSPFLHNALLALLSTALIASADEIHQTFLPNRTGSPWDVLLDSCGALMLMTLTWLILRIRVQKRLAPAG